MANVKILLITSLALSSQLVAQLEPNAPALRENGVADSTISSVQGLPSAIAAYFLLLKASQVKDRDERIKVTRTAFQFASIAEPYDLHYIGPVENPSTLFLSSGNSAPALGGVNLQLRAIGSMMALDRDEGQSMLMQLQMPAPPRPHCDVFLTPRLSEDYLQFGLLVNRLASLDRRGQNAKATLGLQLLNQTQSSLQLPGAITLAKVLSTSDQEALLFSRNY